MSDVRDDTSDDLEARLTRALRHEAEAHHPTVPPSSTIGASARHHDRRHRLELGMAVLAAAAIVAVLLAGPWRGNEDAFVDSGPSATKPSLHLVLDEAAGYDLVQATQLVPTEDGRSPETFPGPEGSSDDEVVLLGGPDPVSPPWMLVAVRTTPNPTGLRADPLDGDQATTIAGRQAVLRTVIAESERYPVTSTQIVITWDERTEVTARFWGLDVTAVSDALASLRQDDAGRWTVATPPSGLHELAYDADEFGTDWYRDATFYRATASDGGPISPMLTITRVAGPPSEARLVARALGSSWERTTIIERTTVRGQPAIIVAPGTNGDANLGPVPHFRAIWFEPEHGVVVDLFVSDPDRAVLDRAIANLREQSDAEWRTTLASCTGIEHGGSIEPLMISGFGGRCPGADEQGG